MSIIKTIISVLPGSFIRFIGRLQFKLPFLKPIIDHLSQRIIQKNGVIQRGKGKGLRFDATNGNPGFITGTSAPKEQQVLADLLDKGDIFYNIGANMGFYTVIGARLVGQQGYVCAFEPTPELADRIRHNCRINDFENVTVVESAVCNHNGTIEFGSNKFDISNSIKKAYERNKFNKIEVNAVSLDSYYEDNQIPDVIMIDIEGAEIEALKGSMFLIQNHKPALMIEVHWLGDDFLNFIEDNILPLGYKATTYSGDPIPKKEVTRYHALLVPDENYH